VMFSSFPLGWGKVDPVECKIPTCSISIGRWWWSGNCQSCIQSEPSWWRWDWAPWQISCSR